MPTKPDCRLLICPPGSGAWNMAVDEILLESAARDGVMTLRFYRWSEPTLSLGYFQKFAERNSHVSSLRAPIVRRSSGGGAILHDQELTYSLAVPPKSLLARDPLRLYDAAHLALVDALATWGIRAQRQSGCSECAAGVPEPFLCFCRRASGDVLIDRWKICGSAQRRRQGAILQHGSVLLRTSTAAPELPGILEITASELHENELIAAWQPRLASKLELRSIPGELTSRELAAARELTISKHASREWIERK